MCRHCGTEKPLSEFPKSKNNKTGRAAHCRVCQRGYQKSWYKKNKEYCAQKKRERAERNREALRVYHREWARKNRDRVREMARARYWANREKERARCDLWAKNNPEKRAVIDSRRRARKLNACPVWLTKEDWDRIGDIYESCPDGYHVDHIIPLQGRNVCGLHVPDNLAVIPSQKNLSKSNKWEAREHIGSLGLEVA